MSELTPRERDILQTARQEWGPSGSVSPPPIAAIESRLAEKPWLGLPVERLAPPQRKLAFGRLFGTTSAVVGVCAIALVGFAVLTKSERAPERAPDTSGTPPAVVAPAPRVVDPPGTAVPSFAIDALPDAPPFAVAASGPQNASRPAEQRRSAVEAPARRDVLGEEIALIRTAQGELRAGSPERALASLESHAARFPGGVLREERMTLQVLALCERAEVGRARAVMAELARMSPGSSHLERLSSSCAAR